MDFSFVYVTAPSLAEAKTIGRTLVEERLAACANVIDGMTSVYWWEGKIDEANEAILIAKTRTDLVDDVIARVRALHSYTCPCVVALPLTSGNPKFLEWIERETASAG
jgi:periplasmic divalent cation tolerance protein